MTALTSAIREIAAEELAVWRLCVASPDFRAMLEDYAEARSALERWRRDPGKAEDYRSLSEELKTRILERLEAATADRR